MINDLKKILGVFLATALLTVFFGCISNCLVDDDCAGELETVSHSENVYAVDHEEDSCPVNVLIQSTAPERASFSASFTASNIISSVRIFHPLKVERINSVRPLHSQHSATYHVKPPLRVLRI